MLMALYFINDRFIHIGKPKEYSISNVKIFPESPATLPFHRLKNGAAMPPARVDISFDYAISNPKGGRIFVMPYADTNKILVKASPLYPIGSGKTSTYFSLTGVGKVSQIKLYIMDKTSKVELYSIFIPVDYTFSY